MIKFLEFKRIINTGILFLIFLSVQLINSQEYSAGLKGGVNYSFNDDGSEVLRNGVQYSAESDFGYQAGVFLELNFGKFLVRPEVFLNEANGEFEFSESPSVYSLQKLSVPLLLGYNLYGPIDIYAGPAYQLILNKEMENSADELLDDHSNLATQIGFKVGFNRIELDLRYDFTIPSEDFQRIRFKGDSNRSYFDEGRLNQLMLSVNYKIFGNNLSRSRRRGNCYN